MDTQYPTPDGIDFSKKLRTYFMEGQIIGFLMNTVFWIQ